MKMKFKAVIWPVVILAIGFVGMRLLISMRSAETPRAQQPRTRIVSAEVVKLQDLPATIMAFGRLKSAQPVTLVSEVSGVIQQGNVIFQPAQSFRKGQLLLKIDDRQATLDLNSAKSDFLTALASVLPEIKVDFPDEYQVWQNYFDGCHFDCNLSALPEVQNEKIKLFLSRFNVYKLFYQVRNLEILKDKHYFIAPFSGSIVSTDLRIGSTARPGTRLGELINLENMEVEVPVAVKDVQWIDRSKPVQFTSTEIPGNWSGNILRIGKNIDERTQTVQVFIEVNKNGRENLYNGIFLQAKIPGLIVEDAFVIPRQAIYNENFVYLIRDGKLDYRQIDIARRETDTVILNGGIADGDTLVVDVMQGVASGMPAIARVAGEGG
ncbi:MAG: efflux RND transporter periplasmic adaptor subunit [Calditrichaeota bacterium]|nr:efflux RND transporter periplasmic adaptor subunit [Calditrichota bacterium]